MKLTEDDWSRLRRLSHGQFRVYQPTRGGGRAWAPLLSATYMTVTDAGYEQETVLICEITDAGRAALAAIDGEK